MVLIIIFESVYEILEDGRSNKTAPEQYFSEVWSVWLCCTKSF